MLLMLAGPMTFPKRHEPERTHGSGPTWRDGNGPGSGRPCMRATHLEGENSLPKEQLVVCV